MTLSLISRRKSSSHLNASFRQCPCQALTNDDLSGWSTLHALCHRRLDRVHRVDQYPHPLSPNKPSVVKTSVTCSTNVTASTIAHPETPHTNSPIPGRRDGSWVSENGKIIRSVAPAQAVRKLHLQLCGHCFTTPASTICRVLAGSPAVLVAVHRRSLSKLINLRLLISGRIPTGAQNEEQPSYSEVQQQGRYDVHRATYGLSMWSCHALVMRAQDSPVSRRRNEQSMTLSPKSNDGELENRTIWSLFVLFLFGGSWAEYFAAEMRHQERGQPDRSGRLECEGRLCETRGGEKGG